MNGTIDGNNLIGNLESSNLTGEISNEKNISAEINPVTTKTVRNYNALLNKPSINEVELTGDKRLEDLNVTRLTNVEIEQIINSIV